MKNYAKIAEMASQANAHRLVAHELAAMAGSNDFDRNVNAGLMLRAEANSRKADKLEARILKEAQ